MTMMNEHDGNSPPAIQSNEEEAPLLAAENIGKRFGPGCAACQTSPLNGNVCPQCGTSWGCCDISFKLYPGEILGIVGESGSGKSTLMRCLNFDEEPTCGTLIFSDYGDDSYDLLSASPQKQRYIRNHLMGVVYQNPHLGLKMSISSSGNVAEKLLAADCYHVGTIRARAAELLERMEIPSSRMDEPPKRFSGGMQQRVQIAKALANRPPILLLDEVTTGLDLSVQAKVLDLIREIQRDMRVAMIVVSHDLGVIRMLSDRTLVLRQGRIVEQGLTDQILEDPQHPYTQLLVHSLL